MPAAAFDVERFRALRAARGTSFGEPLVALAETGSTSDDALAGVSQDAPQGAVYVADAQTRGRGRRGHTWTSPPGENLTFSLVLRPSLPADRVSALTLVVGLAVRAVAARRVSSPIAVKWPNDVVIGRKKLAGILVESRLVGAVVEAVVVGIGVNVHMRAVPAEIAQVATSLVLAGDAAPSREAVLVEILGELEARLTDFGRDGLSSLLVELSAHDALLDERVRVGDVEGVGAGIDGAGGLLVRRSDGRVVSLTSGTVERL